MRLGELAAKLCTHRVRDDKHQLYEPVTKVKHVVAIAARTDRICGAGSKQIPS